MGSPVQQLREELDRNTERAKYLSRALFRLIPVSTVIGIVTVVVIIEFWGIKEFFRMLLQVVLTLTLGATIFAGWFRRLDKKFSEEQE